MIFELKQSNEGKPVEITIMTRSKLLRGSREESGESWMDAMEQKKQSKVNVGGGGGKR